MIALWMIYCVAIAALLTLAAAAAERLLRITGRPSRWVWGAAMMASLLVPAWRLVAPFVPEPETERPELVSDPVTIELPDGAGAPAPIAASIETSVASALSWAAAADVPLLTFCVAASLVVVAWLVLTWHGLRARMRTWQTSIVDGHRVLVSDDVGPAVVGVRDMRIVLPEWALALDERSRGMMLLHEEEHIRARDPRLLLIALAAVVVQPWNPAAWLQLRRLRLAVEIDCDGRVLRRHPDLGAYGSLLLEVGRRGRPDAMLAAAFSEPTSLLERRIRAMTTPRPRQSVVTALSLTAAAALVVVVACETPYPSAPGLGVSPDPVLGAGATMYEITGDTGLVRFDGEWMTRAEAVRRIYGPVLRYEGDDRALLWIITDSTGEIILAELRGRDAGAELGDSGRAAVMKDRQFVLAGAAEFARHVQPTDLQSVEIIKGPAAHPDLAAVLWIALKPGAQLANDPVQPLRVRIRGDSGREGPSATRMLLRRKSEQPTGSGGIFSFSRPEGATAVERLRNPSDSTGSDREIELTALRVAAGGADRVVRSREAPKDEARIRAAIERLHPELLRAHDGPEMAVWFLADEDGGVLQSRVLPADDRRFSTDRVGEAFGGGAIGRVQSLAVRRISPTLMAVWATVGGSDASR